MTLAISDGAGRRAHLVGACGAGMRALAEYLVDAGWRVSGSDATPSPHAAAALVNSEVRLMRGHAAEHLPADAALVIASAAVAESNVELSAARQRGIELLSYPQMLGRLMRRHVGVAAAGTHGKTTTTAMLAWILREAGRDPSMIAGGELLNVGRAGWRGSGELLVAEACEYNRHFLELKPSHAAVLNIEPDHFDTYGDPQAALHSYCEFVAKLPAGGSLLVPTAGTVADRLRAASVATVETCGLDADADWSAADVHSGEGRLSFRLRSRGADCVAISLQQVRGRFNIPNAVAAAAMAMRLDVAPADIAHGLETFPGVRRRFELLGDIDGVTWIDDYAHHPTAVRAVLSAARQEFAAGRIWCAFQPHQVSRTLSLIDEFVEALPAADTVLLLPVYAAREAADVDCSGPSRAIVERLVKSGHDARLLPSLDRLRRTLETDPAPGDVVVLLGAGDIDRVRDELPGRIPRDRTC